MIETKRRMIGDMDVAVTQFPGRKNFSLLVRIAKVVGPTIGAVANEAKGATSLRELMDADMDVAKITNALFAGMDTREVESLVDALLLSTHVNDRPLDFDTMFSGTNVWRLPKILAFVIEVNFGNFTELATSVSGVVAQQEADEASDV